MVKPHSSNFRVITTNVLGVWIFRKFTVILLSPLNSLIPGIFVLVSSFQLDSTKFIKRYREPTQFTVLTTWWFDCLETCINSLCLASFSRGWPVVFTTGSCRLATQPKHCTDLSHLIRVNCSLCKVRKKYSHSRIYMWRVKRICVFEHSVMTNFNCACPAIQRDQGSGFLSEDSSWLTACMSEQRRFWRVCADAQACLNLRCSHRR